MNPKFIDVMVSRKKHLSGVVSNLKPIPQLWLYDHIMQVLDHLSIYATKTRTRIAYEH